MMLVFNETFTGTRTGIRDRFKIAPHWAASLLDSRMTVYLLLP